MDKAAHSGSAAAMHIRVGHFAMDTYPLVVLANEPDTYRSLLAAELPFLRPNLRVLEIDPAELDATVVTFQPAVVICSRALETDPPPECSVLVLCAEEIDSFIQSCDGTIINPRLSDILQAIDRALTPGPPRHQETPRSSPACPGTTPPLKPLQTL